MNRKGLRVFRSREPGAAMSLRKSWSGSSVFKWSAVPSRDVALRSPSFTRTIVWGSNPMNEYSASLFAPIADSRRNAFSNSSWTLTKSERGESFVCNRSAFRESGASLSSAPKVVTHVARCDGGRMLSNNHLCPHMCIGALLGVLLGWWLLVERRLRSAGLRAEVFFLRACFAAPDTKVPAW